MRICVFCASSPGSDSRFIETAKSLGQMLALRSIGLVYGGGNVGLMGAVADGALACNGEVIGVIPRALVERELAHRGVTSLEVVDSMHARKSRMYDLADAFIAMPGGFGTLDELFETLTWAQLGMHQKPIGLLDVAGYWQPLLQMLDCAVAAGLLRHEHRRMLLAESDAGALLDAFKDFRAPSVPKWIGRGEE